jgi:hypothetical protein
MANPTKQDSQLADGSGAPLIGDAQTLVADYVVTWSSNTPTASSTQTIADGTVPTVAELGQAVANIEAKLVEILDVIEAHGLMKDA